MNSIFNSKYFKLIQTFSKEEIKSFELWLRSPWCNSNKNLTTLLEKTKKYHPTFDNRKLTKENLFKKILPHGKFSDRRMNNLLSEGYLAAERFITFQNLNRDENLKKDLLTKEFQNRHLDDWFFRDVNKEIVRLEEKEIKDWEDHLDLLRLNRRVYHHPNQNSKMQPGGQTIVKMGTQLDLVYLLEKAAIINEKIFRNRILKNENHDIEEELKKWRVASKMINNTAVELYKLRFDFVEAKMLEQYYKLRNLFLEKYVRLNEKERKIHLFSLINDTGFLFRKGLLKFTENLPLYKLGLKTNLLLENGKLTQSRFVTIISASNTKGDFDFTDFFLENYVEKLSQSIQKDAYFWAKAHTSYRKGNLLKGLDFLLPHHFQAIYFRMVSKLLTTQIYFDLFLKDNSYQEFLFTYFDSFEKWIQREKFRSKFTKKGFLRFVQKSRTLAKIYTDSNFNKNKITNLFLNEDNIQALDWLKNKKNEILILKSGGR